MTVTSGPDCAERIAALTTLAFAAILLTLASVFGFLNERLLRLPSTVGLLVIALITSLVLIGLGHFFAGQQVSQWSKELVGSANLPSTLLNGALAFLLFAGSLHVDLGHLWSRKWTVLALATFGVVLATMLFGGGVWLIFRAVGEPIPLTWCLVLGAILAPTDPVAVVGLIRRVGLAPGLEATMAGESLFNDGVGVVVFSILLGVAVGGTEASVSAGLREFLLEAGGGGLLGLATGYLAFVAMRRIDNYNLELTISLALSTGTYSLANWLGMSGPIAVVVAGLITGNQGARLAMSETTRRNLMTFWSLIDELLNAVLFLLIGFEILQIELSPANLAAGAIAIPLALAVRALSVFVPTILLHLRAPNKLGAFALLTWGGLRGGISVALALTLPRTGLRESLLTVCYTIVVFTIVVQGTTMPYVIRLFYGRELRRAEPHGGP